MIHKLKTLPVYFCDIAIGVKTFEVRRNDRDYAVDDVLLLQEWEDGQYTGREHCMRVTYIIQGVCGLPPDICVMGIE
jgi:hypothetical protein